MIWDSITHIILAECSRRKWENPLDNLGQPPSTKEIICGCLESSSSFKEELFYWTGFCVLDSGISVRFRFGLVVILKCKILIINKQKT